MQIQSLSPLRLSTLGPSGCLSGNNTKVNAKATPKIVVSAKAFQLAPQ